MGANTQVFGLYLPDDLGQDTFNMREVTKNIVPKPETVKAELENFKTQLPSIIKDAVREQAEALGLKKKESWTKRNAWWLTWLVTVGVGSAAFPRFLSHLVEDAVENKSKTISGTTGDPPERGSQNHATSN